MKKKQFNVRIDEDVLAYMRQQKWPIGRIINNHLRQYIESYKAKELRLEM